MRAAVLNAARTPLVIQELDVIAPRADEVAVRIGACGVCRSDHHIIQGANPSQFPIVLGHEAAGVVVAAGPGVAAPRVGDRVILAVRRICGVCEHCRRGRDQQCTALWGRDGGLPDGTPVLRRDGAPVYQYGNIGGFGERTVVPAAAAVPIPEVMPLPVAALIGCGVTTGVGAALMTARVQPGSSVAVVGTGGVGLSVIQGACIAGAARIIAVDLLDNKLEMATKFGATHALNAVREDALAAVRRLTGGHGADFTFDAIGGVQTVRQAFDMARPGGTVTLIGVVTDSDTVPFPARLLVGPEKTIKGCLMGGAPGSTLALLLIDLYLAGKLHLDEMVSQTYPLDEIDQAFAALKRGENARGVIVYDCPPGRRTASAIRFDAGPIPC
jgi:S-(hydroxymethyl)glutathione dehydrogenase/alcohol dehydrogenase